MLEDNAEKWGKNLRIIGLSIDQSMEKLKTHVEAKGWTKPEHFFRGKSDASEVYGV